MPAEPGQSFGQAAAPGPGFGVGQPHVTTDHGDAIGKQLVGTAERINKGVHEASSHRCAGSCKRRGMSRLSMIYTIPHVNASSSALASWRSAVSKPSVNQA